MAKAGLRLLGIDAGEPRLPQIPADGRTGRGTRCRHAGRRRAAMNRPASRLRCEPLARAAGTARTGRPAGHRTRRDRRNRPQHDRFRASRPAADHRLRGAVPQPRRARRRPDPARPAPHRGPPRRHRGAGADPRPRGPHRRHPAPAEAAVRHPGGRVEVHPGAGRREMPRAPHQAGVRRGRRGAEQPARRVRVRVLRGQPLDSRTRWPSPSTPAREPCCTPATSSSTSCRSMAAPPTCRECRGSATPASTCSCATRPTPRSPGSARRRARSARTCTA